MNSTGQVTAISPGTTTITMTSEDGSFTSPATINVTDPPASYSVRLTGTSNDKYGLAKSLRVMPGDIVTAEVWAKYVDENSGNWSAALRNVMSAIASAATNPTGTLIDGGASGSTGGLPFLHQGDLVRSGDNGTGPKVFELHCI